nr:integrase, catalytic region, zinc finger, CCHC-type, peptidase aspartic, catalytic [Tanacetum cinerariifolium]
MFDELLNPPPSVVNQVPEAIAPIVEVIPPVNADSFGSPSSTTVEQDAPSMSNSTTPTETQSLIIPQDVGDDNLDMEVAHMRSDPHLDHPLNNIIGQLSRPVSTRLQLQEQAPFCYYDAFLTSVEPKTYKEVLTQSCWIEAMQEELHEFERIEVWELVPRPDQVMVITLKWIYKVKLDEVGGILKNKARLVACGTGSRPGVPDVPSDDSEEELSWNSFDDEDVDEQTKGREESEGDKTDESDDGSDDGNDDDNDETIKAGSERDEDDDDNDDEEELAKNDDEDTESGMGGDEVSESKGESDEEETRQEEEESFDPIPKTPEGSEDKGNDKEDQDLRLSEEERIQEEEEADELYCDININQGRGLQVTQNIEDSHVTLTSVHPDGLQESSSMSSFITSMLNPISDAGVESIFTTASSPIVSLQPPTPIMTPSTIATITTSSDAPIPPATIPSTILENLPTFNLIFCFDERLRSLETTFSKYRQTNLFVDVVSAILGIVHQYMTQQMTKAIQEAVQIQTDRLQDSLQRENDEFLVNIDENMKKIVKGHVKSQVKEQVLRILPRIKESMNATLKAEVLTRSLHSSRTSYAIAADLSEMELKKILIEKMEGKNSIQRSDEQQNLYKALVEAYDADKTILDTYGESTILKQRREDDDQEGPSAGSDRGSKRRREGWEHASASTPSETATESAGRSTTGSQSRQVSASKSTFAEEPVQITCQMEEPSHPVFEIGADD